MAAHVADHTPRRSTTERSRAHSNPVIVTRVGSPRAQPRAITASTASTADRADVLARGPNAEQAVRRGAGRRATAIDSNVNRPRTIAAGTCERPVRSHRTNTATTPSAAIDDDQSEQRAEGRSARSLSSGGLGSTVAARAPAPAGWSPSRSCAVCARGRGRRTRRSCRAGASSPCSRRRRGTLTPRVRNSSSVEASSGILLLEASTTTITWDAASSTSGVSAAPRIGGASSEQQPARLPVRGQRP